MATAIISACVNYVQGYGFKFRNETSAKVNFTVHNTNWFSNDDEGSVDPGETSEVGTGADCVDKVTVEAVYPSDSKTRHPGNTIKKSKEFGHQCTSRSFVVLESCMYGSDDKCDIKLVEE